MARLLRSPTSAPFRHQAMWSCSPPLVGPRITHPTAASATSATPATSATSAAAAATGRKASSPSGYFPAARSHPAKCRLAVIRPASRRAPTVSIAAAEAPRSTAAPTAAATPSCRCRTQADAACAGSISSSGRRGPAAMSSSSSSSSSSSPRAQGATAGSDGCHVIIPPDGRVLLVGITGVTGRSALQGLLAAVSPGRTSHQLVAITRSPEGRAARSLPAGVQVVAGNLDDPASLEPALRDVAAVYCHALSKDGATADPTELVRARNLAAAASAAGVRLIVYNSSGGRGCGYGITQMDQKHQVEDILAAELPTVALRATMFMEELWKRYTRPGILKGTFTWSTPSDRPVQLVAARDMGLAAGCLLAAPGGVDVQPAQPAAADGARAGDVQPRRLRLRAIELAGDELNPEQMCGVFARVQGGPVRHNRAPAWPFWFLARDVFRISRFLTERGFGADLAACRAQFPGMMTFEQFLREAGWSDHTRTYEDGIAFTADAQQQQQQLREAGTGAPAAATTATTTAAANPSKE